MIPPPRIDRSQFEDGDDCSLQSSVGLRVLIVISKELLLEKLRS